MKLYFEQWSQPFRRRYHASNHPGRFAWDSGGAMSQRKRDRAQIVRGVEITGRRSLPACLALVAVIAFGCSRDLPPSVLLITVDTLRADALRPYHATGPTRDGDAPDTPRMSGLAREATLFENAAAPMPLTRPSHFSIFTGLYPREHGVVNNQIRLPDAKETLAEILSGHGYHTGGVVAVDLLGDDSGAQQGFAHYGSPRDRLQWSAPDVVKKARAWLATIPADEPFFLWVHLFDPHQPYDPPSEFRGDLDVALQAQLPAVS